MVDFQNSLQTITDMSAAYLPRLALAIITLVIGLWIIRLLSKGVKKALHVREIEPTLQHFLVSLVSILLKVILFIAVIGMIGVETTSFIAVLAAMGFAVGLALQGSLSNFAGGVLILLFKPFKKGHFIQAQGEAGVVEKIEIFTTTLKTADNKHIIIPNGPLANGNIVNFSREKTRRVDWVFGVGYGDDLKKAQKIILSLIEKHPLILKDPAPFCRVSELADSSVNFTVRAWVESPNFWTVHFDIIESVKAEFDKKGITIPFPQRDVHLHQVKKK